MSFATLGDFIDMGGHGLYVWVSWGIALLVIAWNVIAPIARRKTLVQRLCRSLKRDQNLNREGRDSRVNS
jgi:heme exporter protein D